MEGGKRGERFLAPHSSSPRLKPEEPGEHLMATLLVELRVRNASFSMSDDRKFRVTVLFMWILLTGSYRRTLIYGTAGPAWILAAFPSYLSVAQTVNLVAFVVINWKQ